MGGSTAWLGLNEARGRVTKKQLFFIQPLMKPFIQNNAAALMSVTHRLWAPRQRRRKNLLPCTWLVRTFRTEGPREETSATAQRRRGARRHLSELRDYRVAVTGSLLPRR